MTFDPTKIIHLTDFAIGKDPEDRFLPNREPPRLVPSLLNFKGRVLYDDPNIVEDLFHRHYEQAYHDCTIQAANLAEEGLLSKLVYISDRRTLRKIVGNGCVKIPENSFYLKAEAFQVMAERTSTGTLILGCRHRYEETPGGVGKSFERLATGIEDECTRNYRLSLLPIDEDSHLLMRHEVDAVSSDKLVVELKSKKLPKNPRHGDGTSVDYFLNLYIQMVLSNTPRAIIVFHRDRKIEIIQELSQEEIRRKAMLTKDNVKLMFQKLYEKLELIKDYIPEGRQGNVQCSSSGEISVQLCARNSFDLPLLSTAARALFDGDQNEDDELNEVFAEVKIR